MIRARPFRKAYGEAMVPSSSDASLTVYGTTTATELAMGGADAAQAKIQTENAANEALARAAAAVKGKKPTITPYLLGLAFMLALILFGKEPP